MTPLLTSLTNVPLAEIVVKSTIVIAIAAIACWMMRRQSAAMRHRVWAFGLAASLVIPAISVAMPQFTLDVLPTRWNPFGLAGTVGDEATATVSTVGSDIINGSNAHSFVPGPEQGAKLNIAAPPDSESTTVPLQASIFSAMPSMGQTVVLIWLVSIAIGLTLFAITVAKQLIWLNRLRRIDDDDWNTSLEAAARTVGLRHRIVTLETADARVPAVAGIFSPRLVIPADWRNWSRAQRSCILLHELSHINRHDVLAQLLGRLVLTVYWFNPLIWHAVRQLRLERESATDDSVLLAGTSPSDYAEQLLNTLRCYRPAQPAVGVAMAHSSRLDQRVRAILDPARRRNPVGIRFAVLLLAVAGALGVALGGVTLSAQVAIADQPEPEAADPPADPGPFWKESYAIEYPGTLPVSVAYSSDGKILLTGDTSGEVMALVFPGDEPQWRWKTKVDGSHAAVAFSADEKQVFATTANGVQMLDAARGMAEYLIEEKESHPVTIGVFPDKQIVEGVSGSQIVFGTPRGYFVKSWAKGKLLDSIGTISTSTLADGAEPADEAAVPLAVDPKGRSAIMTGPIDPTGAVGGVEGANVLWAYVCGDYGPGSPGNRVMVGHKAKPVSAAWAKEVAIAVTGDADGRVIVWDTDTMKETARLELGKRIAALAISADGKQTAAYAVGKQGEVFVWETAKPPKEMQPIHTEAGDFAATSVYASLAFSPDAKQLAGCAIDKRWLNRLGELIGKVRVWELVPEPSAQLPPKHQYSKALPAGSSGYFAVFNNHSIVMPASKQGAIDFRSLADGGIQMRLGLGEFTIGNLKLSADRQWLAMEQHAPVPPANVLVTPSMEFEVGIWDMRAMKQKGAIAACRRLLDIAAGGNVVAVVREERIELWDVAAETLLREAPFEYVRIDAARFSPDGNLLAISDRNDLIVWRWDENKHERIKLGRSVGSFSFTPDGKYLAEGPTPRETIRIRDLNTLEVVRSLDNAEQRSMNVPRMAYTQNGRVLIACDTATFSDEISVKHRIHLWDTATGSLAHQIEIPSGLPTSLDVSPNGRYLVAMIEEGDSRTLSTWRLDAKNPEPAAENPPPAATE